MFFEFSKYHGTGNDFIIIDDRDNRLSKLVYRKQELIARMCHRNYGIGADGLILLLSNKSSYPQMVYYNADGKEGSFCGNGSRCFVAFAHQNKIINQLETSFSATDGEHHAKIEWFDNNIYEVNIQIGANTPPEKIALNKYFVNTGSPHLVIFTEELSKIDVTRLGNTIRNSPEWRKAGVNVNFVKMTGKNQLTVRTYERGVERETLSCGTGVTAAAVAACVHHTECNEQHFFVDTLGGKLEVSMSAPRYPGDKLNNIRLIGPAEFVFKGEYDF